MFGPSIRAAATAVFLVLALASTGCAKKHDLVVYKLRGRGTQRVYAVTADQAWNISKAILKLEPTEAIEEHRSDGYMLTSDDSSALTASTYMGVFIEPEGRAATKVTFVTRRRTPTQAWAGLSEEGFHRKFHELVSLIAAVGPLPTDNEADAGDAPPDAATEAGADGG
jgi:hypothetical protein